MFSYELIDQYISDDNFDAFISDLSHEKLNDRYRVLDYAMERLGIISGDRKKSVSIKQAGQWANKIFDKITDIFLMHDWDHLDSDDKRKILDTLMDLQFYYKNQSSEIEEPFIISSKSIETLLACIPKEKFSFISESIIILMFFIICVKLERKGQLEGSIDINFLMPIINFELDKKDYRDTTLGFIILYAYKNLKIKGEIEISLLATIMQNFIRNKNYLEGKKDLDNKLIDELSLSSVSQQNITKKVMNNNFDTYSEFENLYKKELANELGVELNELEEVTMDGKFDLEKFSALFENTALTLNKCLQSIFGQEEYREEVAENLFLPLGLRHTFFDKIKTMIKLNGTDELETTSWALVDTSKLKEITNDEKNDSESAIYKKGDSIEFYKLTDKDYEIFMDGKNSDLQHQIIDNLIQEYHALNVKSNFHCG